jgi:hypothetical protein
MAALGGSIPPDDQYPRPGRVKAAGVILYAEAALTLLAAGGLALPVALFGETRRLSLFVAVGCLTALGIATGVVGRSLLNGRRWAWITAIIFSVLSIAANMLLPDFYISVDASADENILQIRRATDTTARDGYLINLLVLWMLGTEPARRYFRRSSRLEDAGVSST